jgi:dephospho-CoA kinase
MFNNKKMIVGLTGGIGSGKSVVAKLFQILGAAIFNSDQSAKLQYFKPDVKEAVIALLGNDAYKLDGSLNKSYISSRVFSDKALLQSLNHIIHPAVAEDFKIFSHTHPNQLIIKESALLVETGLYKHCNKNILVVAPLQNRLNRVSKRDQLSEEEVMQRINSQMSDDEKQRHCDFVIYNNEQQFLMPQVISVFQKLSHA